METGRGTGRIKERRWIKNPDHPFINSSFAQFLQFLSTVFILFDLSGLCQQALIVCLHGFQGLQASPIKPAGFSARMENAVPFSTQAPGAQPPQNQPGRLVQQA